MTTKLTIRLEEYHPLHRNNTVNDTKVRFISDDSLTCYELFTYFIRSALAFGFTMDSIEETISGLTEEYGLLTMETCDEESDNE